MSAAYLLAAGLYLSGSGSRGLRWLRGRWGFSEDDDDEEDDDDDEGWVVVVVVVVVLDRKVFLLLLLLLLLLSLTQSICRLYFESKFFIASTSGSVACVEAGEDFRVEDSRGGRETAAAAAAAAAALRDGFRDLAVLCFVKVLILVFERVDVAPLKTMDARRRGRRG